MVSRRLTARVYSATTLPAPVTRFVTCGGSPAYVIAPTPVTVARSERVA